MEAARRKTQEKPLLVRSIQTDPRNVFDPNVRGEDKWPFRAANAIHIRTRESVIRGFLLAEPGQTTTAEKLEESERILRSQSFIKSAEITAVPTPDGQVDLHVKTQDTWTLQPQINAGTEGGEKKLSMGFSEENFIGYGKTVTYFYKKDTEGVAHEFGYKDPLLFGTRMTLDTAFHTFPTGNHQRMNLAHPFFSINTRWAGGFDLDNETRLQRIFESGAEINRYQRDAFAMSPFVGRRLTGDASSVHRLKLAYNYSEEIFTPQAQTNLATLPANRTLSGPFATWTYDESRFIKETFIDKTERVEDFNLGQRMAAGAGYFGRGLQGSSENSIPFILTDAFGFGGQGSWFATTSLGSIGRYYVNETSQPGDRPVNTLYFGNFNFYRHRVTAIPVTGILHVEGAYVQNADAQNQLEIGGNSGLRGYKNQAFTGNKSMLMNMEVRAFHPKEVLHFFYLGGAAFFDAGQVQPAGETMALKDMQANIGAGFRVGLTRASGGSVIRIDMAYALRAYPGEDRWILSITTGPGFKSSGNTFSKYAGTPAL